MHAALPAPVHRTDLSFLSSFRGYLLLRSCYSHTVAMAHAYDNWDIAALSTCVHTGCAEMAIREPCLGLYRFNSSEAGRWTRSRVQRFVHNRSPENSIPAFHKPLSAAKAWSVRCTVGSLSEITCEDVGTASVHQLQDHTGIPCDVAGAGKSKVCIFTVGMSCRTECVLHHDRKIVPEMCLIMNYSLRTQPAPRPFVVHIPRVPPLPPGQVDVATTHMLHTAAYDVDVWRYVGSQIASCLWRVFFETFALCQLWCLRRVGPALQDLQQQSWGHDRIITAAAKSPAALDWWSTGTMSVCAWVNLAFRTW